LKPVTLFSSDLDGTLAGHPQGTEEFRRRWDALAVEDRPLLVYNSGRLVDDILSFADEVGLPAPDYAIGGVGTLLVDPRDPLRMQNFADRFSDGWSLEKVETVLRSLGDIERQPEVYQHAFKSSWYLHDAGAELLADVEHALKDVGLSTTMVYSSGRDLDILPRSADKGQALGWLCNELGIELDEVVVAGDTDNDRSMFAARGTRGIVVGNALPELRDLARDNPLIYMARQGFALGVVEGLTHWSVFEADPS
jgi:mannosylfructose-6-phosphate phosphatase